jgi:hypothetical protein
MKAQTLFTKAAAGLGSVALAITLGGCAHHSALDTSGQTTGEIRTEASAQQNDAKPGNVLGTAPAPSNTQASSGNPGTPAIISGPAAVDNSGRVYTSSAVGSAGNGSSTGLNTNVNIIPKQSTSTVTVSQQSTSPTPTVTETNTSTTTTQTAEMTPPPAPPVYTPAPTVESTPAPMTSSTTTETTTSTTNTTTTHHRRMRKD